MQVSFCQFVRHTYLVLAFSTFTYSQSYQLPSNLPACAQPALLAALQTSGCQLSDVHCICTDQNLISAVQKTCTAADQQTIAAFAQTYCGGTATPSQASAFSSNPSPTMTISEVATTETVNYASSSASATAAAIAASSTPDTVSAVNQTGTALGALTSNCTIPATATFTGNSSINLITTATTTPMNASNAMGWNYTMTSGTRSAAQPTGTNAGLVSAAPANVGLSAAALAIALGGMTVVFAEL